MEPGTWAWAKFNQRHSHAVVKTDFKIFIKRDLEVDYWVL
jgi:hypothetical protein